MLVRFLYAAVLVAITAPLVGCEPDAPPAPTEITFRGDGTLDFLRGDSVLTRIAIEIAETDSSRTRGLMDRTSLPSRGGMLFIFDEEAPRNFWMRNTPLPLDLVFVREDGSVVNVVKQTRPFSDAGIASTGPAQYVVEVRAGFASRHGIDSTVSIRWQRAN
jgi:hypothetical protein